jgi:hypothetical protein
MLVHISLLYQCSRSSLLYLQLLCFIVFFRSDIFSLHFIDSEKLVFKVVFSIGFSRDEYQGRGREKRYESREIQGAFFIPRHNRLLD